MCIPIFLNSEAWRACWCNQGLSCGGGGLISPCKCPVNCDPPVPDRLGKHRNFHGSNEVLAVSKRPRYALSRVAGRVCCLVSVPLCRERTKEREKKREREREREREKEKERERGKERERERERGGRCGGAARERERGVGGLRKGGGACLCVWICMYVCVCVCVCLCVCVCACVR